MTTADSVWEQWPECPQCGLARQAVCPNCELAGIEFPMAEYQAAAEPMRKTRSEGDEPTSSEPSIPPRVVLACPSCDEAFSPRFYRRCADCGHDFGEGISIEAGAEEELPDRALSVVVALAALAVVLMLYFWWLLAF